MTPLALSAEAMWRVEYPGRNITNTCPEGAVGVRSAQASQPPAASTATTKSQNNVRTMGIVYAMHANLEVTEKVSPGT
jgi:hypothetical protein